LEIQDQKRFVAVVSKADATGGGASRVAEDLSKTLNAEGVFESHHWLGYANGEWSPHYRNLHGNQALRFFHRAINWFSMQAGFPDFFTPELFYHQLKKETDYDIYHFHDISRTFSPIAMRWLGKRVPLVWTFHDCSPFTGGCIYPMGCDRFQIGCGQCPQLDAWPLKTKIDATRFMFNYKKETAVSRLFVPIAPSQWMADEAMKSGMFQDRPRVIPYSVDTNLFRPHPPEATRDILNLPQDRFIVLLNVHSIEDPKKGAKDALKAIELLESKPLVVVLGVVSDESKKLFRHLDMLFLGYVDDRILLSQYCAAADILVFPTYADNLPNAVLEALASGTPAIGYDTGGMADMVGHGVNGWLVPTGDIKGLSEGIGYAQSNPDVIRQWSDRCREKAKSTFSRQSFAQAHMALYEEILDSKSELLPHLSR
jgi:glycosyltransferase involved in cell wall biosynthesis